MGSLMALKVFFFFSFMFIQLSPGIGLAMRHKRQEKNCNPDQATCQNGECISKSGLCDGRTDCTDGSDENFCNINVSPGECEPNERACRNGYCIQKIWYCDGEKDCDDGSDEDDCSGLPKSGTCKSHEFQCKNQNQCIIKSFLCDKEFDCQDQSDEIGCELPRIVQNPVSRLTVNQFSTFEIECKAVGFPSPFINWRLNWGHTCEEPRCYSTNSNGYGTFTVTNAQFIDAGAYSCEAINAIGRIFAVSDTIVTVIPGRPVTPPPTRPVYIPPPTTPIDDPEEDLIQIPTTSVIKIPDCPNFCYDHSICVGSECISCEHNTEGEQCERCKPGFIGDATKGTPFDCQPNITQVDDNGCPCNGHSSECTCSGYCLRCKHNTEGKQCERCKPGYVGDAKFGTPFDCIKKGCNCNEHSNDCLSNGLCIQCQHNTEGNQCERCKPGFFGDATLGTPYDCQPDYPVDY